MKICCFCGCGLSEDDRRATGPTSNYPNCCPACFDRHVIDHQRPKRDILHETGRNWMD